MVSPSDAWSAGSYSSGSPAGKILIERWTGRTWTQLPAGRQEDQYVATATAGPITESDVAPNVAPSSLAVPNRRG